MTSSPCLITNWSRPVLSSIQLCSCSCASCTRHSTAQHEQQQTRVNSCASQQARPAVLCCLCSCRCEWRSCQVPTPATSHTPPCTPAPTSSTAHHPAHCLACCIAVRIPDYRKREVSWASWYPTKTNSLLVSLLGSCSIQTPLPAVVTALTVGEYSLASGAAYSSGTRA